MTGARSLQLDSPWGPMRAVAFEEGPDPDGRMWTVVQCLEKDICVAAHNMPEAMRRLDVTFDADAFLERELKSVIAPAPESFERMWTEAA